MKRSTSWFSVLPSLVIPVCLGMVFYIGLLASIEHQWITDETILRYLMGHPVSKITVALFFVGVASLLLIGRDVMYQFRISNFIELVGSMGSAGSPEDLEDELAGESSDREYGNIYSENDPADSASQVSPVSAQALVLGRELQRSPVSWQSHYLWQRISHVLESIYRNGSAAHVEEELKYLAESDVEQQQQRYSLVQILIWATPMLGFLGTVLGISQALGGISVGPDNDFQTMMDSLKGSLYVAFDTTALALTLSMILMFGQFLVDRFESQLLKVVSHRAHAEIAGQFDLASTGQTASATQQWESKLISTMSIATARQTELWRDSLRWAESALAQSMSENRERFETSLAGQIDQSVYSLATTLDESIVRADQSMAHRWEQWQVVLSENARQTAKTQTEFAQQTTEVCKLLQHSASLTSTAASQIHAHFNTTADQFSNTAAQFNLAADRLSSAANQINTTTENFNSTTDQFAATANQLVASFETVSQSMAKLAALRPNSDLRVKGAEPTPDLQWISVSPEFLSDAEDHAQVIFPHPHSMPAKVAAAAEKPSPEKRLTQSSTVATPAPRGSVDGGAAPRTLPPRNATPPAEVILPFVKKAA